MPLFIPFQNIEVWELDQEAFIGAEYDFPATRNTRGDGHRVMGYRRELAYRLGNVKYAEGGRDMCAAGLGSPAIEWLARDERRSLSVGSRGILVIPKRNCKDAGYWLRVFLVPRT
jgi:hypothetical protein